ncbi:uncharacterized protein A4U43_C07F18590 [Asparagus officinalis]|uniref:C2H2-type domain-containing protein n=1 Tax=Asparagus officinalis TaxID=4686 RepID=A0A5P1ED61_ASPOF|nr:zinc finger protein STOP1 homolog [Asparagus officinalis]ONK63754.1 uncharacterized protein A4U43_C07F18590 [Asparagus officinalis]
MNSGGGGSSDSSCFDSCQGFLQMYEGLEEYCISPLPLGASINTCSASNLVSFSNNSNTSLVHSLSVLREMVQQLQSLVPTMINTSPHHHHHHHHHDDQQSLDAPSTVSRATSLIQDILAAASSLPYAFQQFVVLSSSLQRNELDHHLHQATYFNAEATIADRNQLPNPLQGCNSSEAEAVVAAGGGGVIFAASTSNETLRYSGTCSYFKRKETTTEKNEDDEDGLIVEMDPADLLAKYTHFCQVCGKGFKRDANLRMHMRAHGDEFKTSEALSNPINKLKNGRFDGELEIDELEGDELGGGQEKSIKKYSCPQEGCRWNKKHTRFRPLKSVVCVKNHYKRSHCPKMYVCNRCNRKQFSVLSDLRTHEKHCGDNLRWRCSCGTTFSRKDKLMGHLALFPTHSPAPAPNTTARFIQAPHS